MDDQFYGQDIDNEPPVDPLYEEAWNHADAELAWAADDDTISFEDYSLLFDEAVKRQYERLHKLREEEIAEWKARGMPDDDHQPPPDDWSDIPF